MSAWRIERFVIWAVDDADAVATALFRLGRSGDLELLTGDIYEQGRLTALGHWQDVPYNAANFTTPGAPTWTVASGDVTINRYTLIGKTVIWHLRIATSTLSAPTTVRVQNLPFSIAAAAVGICQVHDGTWQLGVVTTGGGTTVDISKVEFFGVRQPRRGSVLRELVGLSGVVLNGC